MEVDLKNQQYVDWKIHNVTPIKDGYGYRVILIYMDGSEIVQQKSGFKTKKEAIADRDITLGQLYSGKYVVYEKMKVKDFMSFWLEEEMRPRITNATYDTYKGVIKNHIVTTIGNAYMEDLKKSDILQLYKEKSLYSKHITRQIKVILNTSMRYALSKKIISTNPAANVRLPKLPGKIETHTRNIDSTKTLSAEQVITLINASRDTPIYLQVMFATLMGMRVSEIIAVKYSDVDYVNHTLHIQRQLGIKPNTTPDDVAIKTYTKQEIKLKTASSDRIVPIPDCVMEAILEQRKIYEKNRKRRAGEFQDLNYICCSSYGRPRCRNYQFPYFKKLLEENNLPDIRWHDLRSTYCTLLLKNNFSPKAVSKLMGHAKERITVDVYGDTSKIIQDCLEELEPFIEEITQNIKPKITEYAELDYIDSLEEYIEECLK